MVSALSCVVAASLFSSRTAAEPDVTIKMATMAPEGSPWAASLNEWKRIAEENSSGKLKIKLFLGGKLGDENETVLACKRGQIQAVGASTGALASQIPELNVLELPYLFSTAAEADDVLDNVIKSDVMNAASARGLVFGFWSENGFRSFGGKFAVNTPADLKGKKMRSQESPAHLAMYRAFGASPVPIPTTEALTAIQTGVVEGYDQTPLFAFAASWHTVSTHYSVSEHIYQPAAIMFNKVAFDTWPAEVKAALAKANDAVVVSLRRDVRAMTPLLLDNLTASGVTVNVLSAAERAPFQALAKDARSSYIKGASTGEKELYKKITDALAKRRGG